jgi:cell division inhibitor SulA
MKPTSLQQPNQKLSIAWLTNLEDSIRKQLIQNNRIGNAFTLAFVNNLPLNDRRRQLFTLQPLKNSAEPSLRQINQRSGIEN